MTADQRREQGLLFAPGDPELAAIKLRTHCLNQDYNACREDEKEKREEILGRMLRSIGTGSFLQGPITFHYGIHTTIGEHVFINFNFTCQDDADVVIEDNCSFGPNVTIVTPVHPMVASERRVMKDENGKDGHFCYAKPVHIGSDCWIGANVVICPGVTIGAGCVIGAGSVVVHDVPSGTFAAGNPCRVIREITEADSMLNLPERLGGYSI